MVTQEPLRSGVHYFEFVLHMVGSGVEFVSALGGDARGLPFCCPFPLRGMNQDTRRTGLGLLFGRLSWCKLELDAQKQSNLGQWIRFSPPFLPGPFRTGNQFDLLGPFLTTKDLLEGTAIFLVNMILTIVDVDGRFYKKDSTHIL